jgi:hypothetical protein
MKRQEWLERAKEVLSNRMTYRRYMEAIKLHNIGHRKVFSDRDDWEPVHECLFSRRERWFAREGLRAVGGLMLMNQGIFQGDPEWDPIFNERDFPDE